MGLSGWISTALNDWDSDGCNDSLEDLDDDNDGFLDTEDNCVKSDMNSNHGGSDGDLDDDGCLDASEDMDIDNDGIENGLDNCQDNPTSDWVSTILEDVDQDGCHDDYEDADDDNDGVLDSFDNCPNSISSGLDIDNDGCIDDIEDDDDDGDGIPDSRDNCPNGLVNWVSNKKTDADRDGCMDSIEDTNVEMSITQLLSSSSVITASIFSIIIVLLSGLVLVQRSRRSPIAPDYTDEIIERHNKGVWKEDDSEKRMNDLKQVGYSPEVARAIVQNENQFSEES
jgi:hypothetical protein